MKITQTKSKKGIKKIILITAVVLFIVACGYTGLALKQELWPFNFTTAPTQEEKDAANNFPTTSPKSDAPVVDSSNSDKDNAPVQNTDQVPVNQALSAKITQLEEKGSTIYFSAAISGTSTQGTCVVNFTNPNDKPVTKQVEGTIKGSAVACGPVEISNLEFSYLGQWAVDFHFYADGKQTSVSDTIIIR